MTLNRHQTLPKIDDSPTNYKNRNISLANNHRTVLCTHDNKSLNCKNHKTIKPDELQHANMHTHESLEENQEEQYNTKYRLRKAKKTLSKREVNEKEDDPWDIISPIGKK